MTDDKAAAAEPDNEKEQLPELKKGEVIPGMHFNWTIVVKVGEGAFGGIYKVTNNDKEHPGKEYAMKIEAMNSDYPVLKLEVNVLKELKEANAQHACVMYGKGISKKYNFNFIVMTLLDKSISGLLKLRSKHSFSLCTALRVGSQMLLAIRELHTIGYLHRDLKPANFAVGRGEEQTKVFMIDYGMCRKYRKPNGVIRYPRTTAEFRGTVNYAPLVAHQNQEQARKDEIEAWLYILLEMISGRLPWSSSTDHNELRKQKFDARNHTTTTSKVLFAHDAKELRELLDKVDKCKYSEDPDYDWVQQLLTKIHAAHCKPELTACPHKLDWMGEEDHKTQDTVDGRPPVRRPRRARGIAQQSNRSRRHK